jgi:hypothetical protein
LHLRSELAKEAELRQMTYTCTMAGILAYIYAHTCALAVT